MMIRHRLQTIATITGCLVLGVILLLVVESVSAQTTSIAPNPMDPNPMESSPSDSVANDEESANELANEGSADDEDAADDLDKLLDMADKDFSQVSKVNVMAPSLEMEVSTVSRQESTVGRSPAAVFVVTNEMIRRSGARSVPEVLRMAPGVNVARIDANKWAISVRGFNGRFANKLLIQIDGRSVYTPLFGGTFWDVQNVVLEDVDRIEVIRGPGASVWGTNAMNGIINVITKSSEKTLGGLFQAGAGMEENGFATARYGSKVGKDLYYRLYGQWNERDRAFDPNGDAHDDSKLAQGGFRTDWKPNDRDTITLQGDYYDGRSGRVNYLPAPVPPTYVQRFVGDDDVSGGNVLMRWTRELDEHSDFSAQIYYDRTEREWEGIGFHDNRDILDFDFQHRFRPAKRHGIVWGMGYRNTRDCVEELPFEGELDPARRADDVFSYFLQDEITLVEDRLYFTVGSKFEHNDYTGFEYQPTGRLLWTPSPRHSLWASISRAVHTPVRATDDAQHVLLPTLVPMFPPPAPPVPVFPVMSPNRALDSENLMAYEAGIRVQPTKEFYWDLEVFFHKYENLNTLIPGVGSFGSYPFPTLFVPYVFQNRTHGETYGFELAASYQIQPKWRLHGAYSFLVMQLHSPAGLGALTTDQEEWSPRNQLYVQSSWDVCPHWQLDTIWRYVDRLAEVPSYNTMDVRLAWRPDSCFEAALVGRHLLDSAHPEFVSDLFAGNARTEVQREIFGMITYHF